MALTSTMLPLAAARGYAGSSADTSDSGGDMSVSGRSCGAGHQNVRTVTLCRRHSPVQSSTFGFTLRGGKEYGTGCFVSAVERGSEAHCQGLMVGDQIIRVNGYSIEDATHKEILFLIQNQSSVYLKVRSVGMIPSKDSYSDTLTWRIVEPDPGITVPPDNHSDHYRSSSDVCEEHSVLHSTDVRLVINVPPRAKLGCGICKGPDWKPGIFVQFTKENSIARCAGLRQGDQILQCNNIVFTPYMEFSEATSVLRNSGVLELVVRKGSGLDLFAGESSGYNSSASSVAGDQSPETWPNKRLSIVKEESIIDSERLSHNDSSHRNGMERWSEGDRIVPSNCNEIKSQTTEGGCTVIHVGPSVNNVTHDLGPDVPSEKSRNNSKLAEICMVSKQLETTTTTVLVEVHQTEDETVNNQSDTGSCQLTNSSSACSLSSSGANSLCSAISQELQRRSERRANDKTDGVQSKVDMFKTRMDKEKVEQHQQLMEEFKRAHRKMFANETPESKLKVPVNVSIMSKEERETLRRKRQTLDEKNAATIIQESPVSTVKEKEFKPERGKQNTHEADTEMSRLGRRQRGAAPPPPPLPKEDQTDNISTVPRAPPLPPPPPSPPDCPTPDYDTQSLTSEISIQAHKTSAPKTGPGPAVNGGKNASSDFVEMQSIESFKLTNPSVMKPKPPSTYFGQKAAQNRSSDSSSISSRDTVKPTVTIREYPSNQERKNPERFSFLPQNTEVPNLHNDEPISSRLQNELTQTLSRANLKGNEEMSTATTNGTGKNVVTISISTQSKQQPPNVEPNIKQNPFYLFNNDKSKSQDRLRNEILNNNTKMLSSTPLNSSEQNNTNSKRSSIHFPVDSSNKGSVTFNFGKKEKSETRIVTVVQPNGILKNGPAGNVSQIHINTAPPSNKPTQKSIKFGGITTIAQNSFEPKM